MVLPAIAKAIFGSANDRHVKKYQPKVDAINALEPAIGQALRRGTAGQDRRIPRSLSRTAPRSTTCSSPPLPWCARPASACSACAISTYSWSAAWCSTTAPSPRCGPVKARRWWRRCRSTSTPSPAWASTSSPSTTTSPSATASGWARSTASSASPSASSSTTSTDEQRKEAYAADVTYGTNNEFGFDYLRDNMKYARDQMVQRGHVYAIVDEVDSILIDEARTPLIISGPSDDHSVALHDDRRRSCR